LKKNIRGRFTSAERKSKNGFLPAEVNKKEVIENEGRYRKQENESKPAYE